MRGLLLRFSAAAGFLRNGRSGPTRFFRRTASVALIALVATLLNPAGASNQVGGRLPSPEDRYAMAGGCYAVQSMESGRFLVRRDDGFAATAADPAAAEPFFFQATDLGRYLLFGSARDYFAVRDGLVGEVADTVTGSTAGGIAEGLSGGVTTQTADTLSEGPLGAATSRGTGIVATPKATELADWDIDQVDAESLTLHLPSTGQTLVADNSGALSLGSSTPPGSSGRFAFLLTTGCAKLPEVDVNITGDVVGGDSFFAETRGFLEAHVHMMAYEFLGGRVRCGIPWHRYGVERALVDCPDHEPGGAGAALEAVLSPDSIGGHDTAGWPTFPYWPRYNSLTHEQLYYKWLERAWRGGLRMMVNLLVDNNALCEAYPYRKNSCNEMDGVRLQAQRIRELERYIDAQSGGPGEGWFRIVTDPFQARRVINDGNLAVVLGIEVSTPLDCGLILGMPQCDTTHIDRQLDAVYDLGVRQMEMTNKFDNALTGVTGDAGATGVVVNSGNVSTTGRSWQMKTCDKDAHPDAHDKEQSNLHDQTGSPDQLSGRDSIFGGVLQITGQSGVAPVYPEGPHCNIQGLSALGKHFLQTIMRKGMIFDPDHMSALARTQALDVIEAAGYSGVLSSHSWSDDTIYPRVLKAGGVVAPHAGGSTGFIGKWQKQQQWGDPRYVFGVGFGSDINGFSRQGAPRGANAANKVTYPFTGFGGVTVEKQRSGQRVYDVNTDGVAHYGLYPDWLEDLRRQAGQQIIDDMARGPEAYLQMWERSLRIAPNACRPDIADLTDQDVAQLSTGMTPENVLRTIGQPKTRGATTFDYCMTGNRTAVVTFTGGTVTAVDIA